mgnify:CR=1 FL=1
MYLIATNQGLFKLNEKLERITEKYKVEDAILPYVCSPDVGVVTVRGEKVIREGCWRLYKDKNEVYASIEGPKIYEIREKGAKEIIDLSDYWEKLGWTFHIKSPHVTDICFFKDKFVVGVEVGNLLVGETLDQLKPLDFFADVHNLMVKDGTLFIATAEGIYLTRDLKNFKKVASGYTHALVDLGEVIVTHKMSPQPLLVSKDGIKWERVRARLPRPMYGETSITKVDKERVLYSTTKIFEVDVIEGKAFTISEKIPFTRRIINEEDEETQLDIR